MLIARYDESMSDCPMSFFVVCPNLWYEDSFECS
jgi:hypothetical protein